MTSLRCLVQVRSTLSALGTKLLTPKQFCHPSVSLLHTLVTKNEDLLLRASLITSVQGLRWESDQSSGPPENNHWSRQWEKDRMANKRFSNEGRYFRSMFTRRTGDQLWKGVTSQSTAAAKSGRGKRGKLRRKIDLNKGQVRCLIELISSAAASEVQYVFCLRRNEFPRGL